MERVPRFGAASEQRHDGQKQNDRHRTEQDVGLRQCPATTGGLHGLTRRIHEQTPLHLPLPPRTGPRRPRLTSPTSGWGESHHCIVATLYQCTRCAKADPRSKLFGPEAGKACGQRGYGCLGRGGRGVEHVGPGANRSRAPVARGMGWSESHHPDPLFRGATAVREPTARARPRLGRRRRRVRRGRWRRAGRSGGGRGATFCRVP